jgi:hypothetical protein
MSYRLCALLGLVAVATLSCDNPFGSKSDRGSVTVRLALAGSSGWTNIVSSGATADIIPEGPIVLTGSNGALTITEIALVVSHIEFEREDDACEGEHRREGDEDDDEGEDEDCDEFEMSPAFLKLALPAGSVKVATDALPEGTWTELTFRVKNVDFDDDEDEDDDEERKENADLQRLLGELRTEFPDWPPKASLVVKGTFLAAGSTVATSFTTFFDGEIKVKMRLVPPLVISGTGASREVLVELDPAAWFKLSDGRVLNLASLDFGRTRKLVWFRTDIAKGFVRVRTVR